MRSSPNATKTRGVAIIERHEPKRISTDGNNSPRTTKGERRRHCRRVTEQRIVVVQNVVDVSLVAVSIFASSVAFTVTQQINHESANDEETIEWGGNDVVVFHAIIFISRYRTVREDHEQYG